MTPQAISIGGASDAIAADRNNGGRPRKRNTSVISVRIPDNVYDAYCKASLRTDIDVRTIMRQVLSFYAPKS